MGNEYQVVRAVPEDHEVLTEIAIQSKRHWNYPEAWIQGWLRELTILSSYIESNSVFKLYCKSNDFICGFCALEWDAANKTIEIAHLWLKPEFIGRGLGKYLLEMGLMKVKHLGAKKVTVIADPNATGFYKKLGFKTIGHNKSTPEGRLLPEMVLEMT